MCKDWMVDDGVMYIGGANCGEGEFQEEPT